MLRTGLRFARPGASVRRSIPTGIRAMVFSSMREPDMLGDIKSDLHAVKSVFSLKDVPRESFYFGLAGVMPYMATSLSTVYLAFDINRGTGLDPETARQLLTVMEPIQILSFLGAIHWGLEYAGYGGHHSYRRYAIGVGASAIAWPTIFMPVDYALITQFAAFSGLYFVDAKATRRGLCPPWYATYRFVLTFIVGGSIVVGLVGRGQVGPKTRLGAHLEEVKHPSANVSA